MNGRMEAEQMAAEHEAGKPPPVLTDSERAAIERQVAWLFSQARNRADIHSCDILLQEASTLRGLLARSATEGDQ